MRSLLQSISRFFQRLFNIARRPASSPAGRIEESDRPQSDRHSPSERFDPRTTPPLRRLIYQAIYAMPQHRRTHAAQVGATLRKKDPAFSYEKYSFAKLIDLLEAVPELVTLERIEPDPNKPNSAPVYYVRPVLDVKRLLSEALKEQDSEDGWVHLDSLKAAIAPKAPSFSVQTYGFSDFRSFVENTPSLVEFKADHPSYVRLQPKRVIHKPRQSPRKPRNISPVIKSLRTDDRSIEPLSKFAGFSADVLNQKVSELAAIALPENWYFGPQPPADFAYPILKSYLRYTFIRLQHEGKVIASLNREYHTFNTGLLDTLLRPVYGLFSRPTQLNAHRWNLDFCIAGESQSGKTLVSQLPELPSAANYLSDPEKAFYDLTAG
ncbi:MAG: DUF3825 domain-containing protein, partial [Phormidesmis sp.]